MKLLFLTFSPISNNVGHLARLSVVLDELSKINSVSVLYLGKNSEPKKFQQKHKNVSFFHFPIGFDGWEVSNLTESVICIDKIIQKTEPNLVILQIEVWDLMRELGRSLKGRIPFATVTHAMPFLGSPIKPSGNFTKDVLEYANSGIDSRRKKYNLKHFKEAKEVFENISVITPNETVGFFLHKYFKKLTVYTLPPSPVIANKDICEQNGLLVFRKNNKPEDYPQVLLRS